MVRAHTRASTLCSDAEHTRAYTHAHAVRTRTAYAHFVLSWHEDRLVCKQFHFCCCRPFSEVGWKEEGNRRNTRAARENSCARPGTRCTHKNQRRWRWERIQREREKSRRGKSVEIGRWNLHTSCDLRGDVKRLRQKRSGRPRRLAAGQGARKRLNNVPTKCPLLPPPPRQDSGR